MNLKTKYLIEKVASCLCLAIAVMLLFSGWITIKSGEYRKEIRKEIKNIGQEIKDVDMDDMEEMQEELDDLGIDISLKSIFKSVKKLYDAVEDVALSPKEMIGVLPVVNKLSNIMEELEENDMGGFGMMPMGIDSVVEAIEEYKLGLTVLAIFFYATVILEIALIVLHILNKKAAGYSAVAVQLIWLVLALVTVMKANSWAMDEFDEKILKVTAAPYFALILVIAACVLWYLANKDYQTLGGAVAAAPVSGQKEMPSFMANVASSVGLAQVRCSQCGSLVKEGSAFCSQCGNKIEEQVKNIYCENCGQSIKSESAFCPYCGTIVNKEA